MKKVLFFAAIASAFAISCTKAENDLMDPSAGRNVIQAVIEDDTRSSVTDGGTFNWTSGDKITLVGADDSRATYNYVNGNNFSLEGSSSVTNPTVAYYPANDNHTTTSFRLADSYSYETSISTNAAMIAIPPTQGDTYAFRHLGGLMRFNVKNVPVGAKSFSFTAEGKKITGDFTICDGIIETSDSDTDNNTVTINFTELTAAQDMTFYVPLPVGEYGNYTVAFSLEGPQNEISYPSTNVTNTIARKTLLLMPTFSFNTAGDLIKGNAPAGVIDLEEGDKEADIVDSEGKGAEVVVVPGDDEGDADAVATLNYKPADDGSSTLSLSDGSADDAVSGESDGNVVVNAAPTSGDAATVASLDIDMPTMTVTLQAPAGKTVTYNTVTATTAQNTLIIGEGVIVETLTIEDGNVVIDGGTVKSINNQNSKSITYVINSLSEIKDVPEYATAVEIKLTEDIEIKLTEDISTSDIYVLSGKEIILNGNGHTLTSSAGRAINVSSAEKATIKNLTIIASGERAINIIQNSKEVIIDNVTATAANYTVNVASSAPGAKVTINNSTLNGLNVVNVASEGAVVAVTNSTINCNDNNTTKGESYAALCLNKDAINGTITATDCTINVTEGSDSKKARNGADGGEVTINGSADEVYVMVAAITYEGSNYYHSVETLDEAFDYAKSSPNAKISLIRDIRLNEEWTPVGTADEPFSGHFDGNNKTISDLIINSGDYAGLFGYVSGGATIENVTLKDVCVSGGERMAALIGKITGNAVVSNCTVSGSVTGSDSNTGGIIGEIVTGTVQLTELTNNATVTNTKASNSRAGGIVGQVTTDANVTLNNCTNTGNITTQNGYAGGIVSAYQSGTLAICNCTNSGELTGYYTGNMLGWYTSIRSISISTEANVFDINAIGCVDIAISSKMSLYGKNYFVNRMADLTGVTQTAQTFSDIFAEDQIGESPKALWDKLIAFYNHAAETNANFAGYPKTYWAMFNHTAGYPSDGAWNTYFNSYNASVGEDQKLTQEEFSSASWREKIVYLAPEE